MANSLLAYLEEETIKHGGLTIAQYMETCLYHPQWGYYRVKNPLGREGDFVTAPEISQVFGELIGVWHIDLWQRLGRPEKFHLIECGPGQGTLLADFLRQAPAIYKSGLRLHLVEINETLRSIQEHTLKEYQPRFHTTIEEALLHCADEPTFILGNEFLDALPIRQFEKGLHGWRERLILCKQGTLSFGYGPEIVYQEEIPFPENAPIGAIFEYCILAQKIIEKISKHLETHVGSALFIDYGPLKPGYGDTLQAVSKHGYHNPLSTPGQADLTAHVNFSHLLRAAHPYNILSYGPVQQNQFLEELGIRLRAQQLTGEGDGPQRLQVEKAIHRLISPSQMGALFKAFALTHPVCPIPAGFMTCITSARSVA